MQTIYYAIRGFFVLIAEGFRDIFAEFVEAGRPRTMSGRGGIYKGPDGDDLYGDGTHMSKAREVKHAEITQNLGDEINQCLQIIVTNAGNWPSGERMYPNEVRDAHKCCDAIHKAVERAAIAVRRLADHDAEVERKARLDQHRRDCLVYRLNYWGVSVGFWTWNWEPKWLRFNKVKKDA